DLAVQRLLCFAVQSGGSRLEYGGELVSPLGQELDRVGVEKWVIAHRGRDGASAGRVFQAGLGVIGPVAAGLEHVDANDLLLRKAGCEGKFGVGALEL